MTNVGVVMSEVNACYMLQPPLPVPDLASLPPSLDIDGRRLCMGGEAGGSSMRAVTRCSATVAAFARRATT